MPADPQDSESIIHRHGKVKTSKVSHQITHSSQLVVRMPAWEEGEVKKQKERNKQKGRFKMKDIFHFHLRELTAHLLVSVPDQLQPPPPTTSLKVIYANFKFLYITKVYKSKYKSLHFSKSSFQM